MKHVIFISFILLQINATAQADLEKGLKLYGEGNWKEAESSFKTYFDRVPDYGTAAYIYYGISQLNQGKYREAIATFNTILTISSLRIQEVNTARYNLAKSYALIGDTAKSLMLLKKMIAAGYANFTLVRQDTAFFLIKKLPGYSDLEQAMKRNSKPCEWDSNYRKLDFFLGNWDVYFTAIPDQKVGTDTIYSIAGDCGILENFTWYPQGSFFGKSLCFYDAVKQKFLMNWTGSNADTRVFEETRSGRNFMELMALAVGPSNAQIVQRRMGMTYDPVRDEIRQVIYNSYDIGKTWILEWDAIFRRAK